MDLEQLGTLIRNKRKEIGIPLSNAATRAGISRSTLSIIEAGVNPQTGKPSRPAKDILERLAQTLHMSQAEIEEMLSLAGYQIISLAQYAPTYGSTGSAPQPAPPIITKLDNVIYVSYVGYIEAFEADTGRRIWPEPARLQIPTAEVARPLPREEISSRSPGRQASKRQRVRETEPLSSEKGARIAATGLTASKLVLEPGSDATDATKKKKRRL